MRDITAEHYAGQREAGLAAMGLLLSRRTTCPRPFRVPSTSCSDSGTPGGLCCHWTGAEEPSLTSTGPAVRWTELPGELRETIGNLRQRPLLTPTDGTSPDVGISIEHPEGQLAVWIEVVPPAVHGRGPDAVRTAVRVSWPGAAPGPPDGSAAGNRPAVADLLRGHGIALMRSLVQQVTIEPGSTGTTVAWKWPSPPDHAT